jgi:hypothetical protein
MNTDPCRGFKAVSWKDLYQTAMHERDLKKLPERIAEAEAALVVRARELSHAAENECEEVESVNDAMYILHALSMSLRWSTATRSAAADDVKPARVFKPRALQAELPQQ